MLQKIKFLVYPNGDVYKDDEDNDEVPEQAVVVVVVGVVVILVGVGKTTLFRSGTG